MRACISRFFKIRSRAIKTQSTVFVSKELSRENAESKGIFLSLLFPIKASLDQTHITANKDLTTCVEAKEKALDLHSIGGRRKRYSFPLSSSFSNNSLSLRRLSQSASAYYVVHSPLFGLIESSIVLHTHLLKQQLSLSVSGGGSLILRYITRRLIISLVIQTSSIRFLRSYLIWWENHRHIKRATFHIIGRDINLRR